MSSVGSTVPNFPVPVCSSFKPYLLNSQVFCPHYIEGILIFELLLFRIVTREKPKQHRIFENPE